MNKGSYIKNYILRIGQMEAEMRSYSAEEIQYVESQKLETNIVRIQCVSIIILVALFLRIIINVLTKDITIYTKWYLEFDIAMIATIILHEFIYNFYIKKKRKNTTIGNHYVFSWYACFLTVAMIFLSVEVFEVCSIYKFFIFTTVISVLPLISIKIQLIYSIILFLAQLVLLLIKDASPREYQLSVLVVFGGFIVGRILYVYFVRVNVLNLRLKNALNDLNIQNERYTILQNLTKDTIFEYNFKEDRMMIINYNDYDKKIIYNYVEKLKHQYHSADNIDVREFIKVYRELIYGKKRSEMVFQYKDKDGKMQYSKALFMTIYEEKNPSKLIGKVYKIDEIIESNN